MPNPPPLRPRRRPAADPHAPRAGAGSPRTGPIDPTATDHGRAAADRSDHQVVADNIATLRRAHGLTAEALAEASGVHASLIGRIESGRTFLPATTLARLAHALDVPVDRLHRP